MSSPGPFDGGAGGGGRLAVAVRLNAAQLADLYATGTISAENLRDVTISETVPPSVKGTLSAKGGTATRTSVAGRRYSGEDGTVRWIQGPKSGLKIIVR